MAKTKPTAIYWDSCVFIDALRKTEGRYTHILEIEKLARQGQLRIYTSTFTNAEVVKTKDFGDLTEEETRMIRAYMSQRPRFTHIPVDTRTAREAADIVREHKGIKPPDAIHVATAIRNRCDALLTYDGSGDKPGLLAFNGKIGSPPLRIVKPDDYGDRDLLGNVVS